MMILAKVVDDPSSGMCLNVSYADVVGPVANFNPTGSPYAQGQQVRTPTPSPPTPHALPINIIYSIITTLIPCVQIQEYIIIILNCYKIRNSSGLGQSNQ